MKSLRLVVVWTIITPVTRKKTNKSIFVSFKNKTKPFFNLRDWIPEAEVLDCKYTDFNEEFISEGETGF